MKLIKNYLVVEIEGARFQFQSATPKSWLEILEMEKGGVAEQVNVVLSRLVSVENLHDEDDQPVSVDGLRTLEFPLSLLLPLVNGYKSAVIEALGIKKGAEAKNDVPTA